jgi:hypothetical protein
MIPRIRHAQFILEIIRVFAYPPLFACLFLFLSELKRRNMEMKKIISVRLCICLMSGCDKPLSHGRPVNAVAEDKGSEAPHSLTLNTSNASASVSSKTPVPISEPSKSAPPLSDMADTGSLVVKIGLCATAVIALIAVVYYGGYDKLLRVFASSGFVPMSELVKVNLSEDAAFSESYKPCFKPPDINCYFDWYSEEWIDERSVWNEVVPLYSN